MIGSNERPTDGRYAATPTVIVTTRTGRSRRRVPSLTRHHFVLVDQCALLSLTRSRILSIPPGELSSQADRGVGKTLVSELTWWRNVAVD